MGRGPPSFHFLGSDAGGSSGESRQGMGGNQKRQMVISEIRSLYRDENDLFRTVTKRIYEEWDAEREQWDLKKIEFIYEDPELPVPSDTPAVAVEQRHGWLIPPAWEFISEVWEYERKRVSETVYDHESEVGILR